MQQLKRADKNREDFPILGGGNGYLKINANPDKIKWMRK